MISWAFCDNAQTSSSEEFEGNCAWTQMFPSSNSGMNSPPRNGSAATVPATTVAKRARVSQRWSMQRCNCRK